MPKSSKPSGGRPNYEPRYGEKKTSYQDKKHRPADGASRGAASATSGSRSAGHRGHRPAEQEAPAKGRWTSQQRAGRDEARGIRTHAHSDRSARPSGDGSGAYRSQDRPSAAPARGADSPRSNRDRPAYGTQHRDDRPARSYDDRPARSYSDRPARSYSDRPARSYSDRPARSYSGQRPARDRAERPGRADWNARPDRTTAQEQHVDVVHERLQAEAIQAESVSDVTFGALGLGDNIVRTLADLGAATPFPIQAATIPRFWRARTSWPRPHRLGQDHRLRRPARRARPPVAGGSAPGVRPRAQGPDPRADPRARASDRPDGSSRSPEASACSPPRSTAACRRAGKWVRSRRASTSSSARPAASRTCSTRASSTSRRSASP